MVDRKAVRLLLDGDGVGSPALRRLARDVKARLENRLPCPDCGDEGPHEDNGEGPDSFELSLLCRGCKTQWDPNV
jgi:hypothetical protein